MVWVCGVPGDGPLAQGRRAAARRPWKYSAIRKLRTPAASPTPSDMRRSSARRSPRNVPMGGFAIFLLFSYALSWGCTCLGVASKSPESAQGIGLVILFPSRSSPTRWCQPGASPAVIRLIADWNPVSAVTAAARHLWANPNPSASIHAWPMQHPVTAALLWSAALLVIFAPLATMLYRRRTIG